MIFIQASATLRDNHGRPSQKLACHFSTFQQLEAQLSKLPLAGILPGCCPNLVDDDSLLPAYVTEGRTCGSVEGVVARADSTFPGAWGHDSGAAATATMIELLDCC